MYLMKSCYNFITRLIINHSKLPRNHSFGYIYNLSIGMTSKLCNKLCHLSIIKVQFSRQSNKMEIPLYHIKSILFSGNESMICLIVKY